MNTESPNSVIQSHDAEWNSKTDWDNKTLPPCWFHLLNEIEGVCVECGCPAMCNTHPILKGKAICDVCWDIVDPPKDDEEDKDQHWGSAMSILLYGKEAE
tara:strand:- start:1048 stop:1347 length:300 start_codon:yes stop_codon:yes gene_type:complete